MGEAGSDGSAEHGSSRSTNPPRDQARATKSAPLRYRLRHQRGRRIPPTYASTTLDLANIWPLLERRRIPFEEILGPVDELDEPAIRVTLRKPRRCSNTSFTRSSIREGFAVQSGPPPVERRGAPEVAAGILVVAIQILRTAREVDDSASWVAKIVRGIEHAKFRRKTMPETVVTIYGPDGKPLKEVRVPSKREEREPRPQKGRKGPRLTPYNTSAACSCRQGVRPAASSIRAGSGDAPQSRPGMIRSARIPRIRRRTKEGFLWRRSIPPRRGSYDKTARRRSPAPAATPPTSPSPAWLT